MFNHFSLSKALKRLRREGLLSAIQSGRKIMFLRGEDNKNTGFKVNHQNPHKYRSISSLYESFVFVLVSGVIMAYMLLTNSKKFNISLIENGIHAILTSQ